MDECDEASTLRRDCLKGDITGGLLRPLRTHASTLRQLHVEHLNDDKEGMSTLLQILPSCAWLTVLVLRECWALTRLPESLGLLSALATLNLSECRALTGLPESLGQVATLTTLNLSGCGALMGLPESLGKLAALTTLDLRGASLLASLPESLGRLAGLTALRLGGCKALKEVPRWVEQQASWASLGLPPCIRALPESLGRLDALTTLNLSWCDALTALPDSLGRLAALTTLDLGGCRALTGLPETLVALSIAEFNASDCHLVFPLANAGFTAVKRFFQDFARCAAPLQHDRVMLLGDGGAGKTTLAVALRLHSDPVSYLASMRVGLREKLEQHWLKVELDPRDRCPGYCVWCLGITTVAFDHLLKGLVDVSSLKASHCSACVREFTRPPCPSVRDLC